MGDMWSKCKVDILIHCIISERITVLRTCTTASTWEQGCICEQGIGRCQRGLAATDRVKVTRGYFSSFLRFTSSSPFPERERESPYALLRYCPPPGSGGGRNPVSYAKSGSKRGLTDECVNVRRAECEEDGGPSGTRRMGAEKTATVGGKAKSKSQGRHVVVAAPSRCEVSVKRERHDRVGGNAHRLRKAGDGDRQLSRKDSAAGTRGHAYSTWPAQASTWPPWTCPSIYY